MKHYFIINPVAGKGKAETYIRPQIEVYAKRVGLDYQIHVTKAKGEAIEFVKAEAAKGEAARFYACGGDGTLFEVVNGAVGFENAEVAVIPLGSGNDFIRLFGTKEQFVSIPAQAEGTPVKLDVIKCGDVYAINQCSMGIDAEINAKQMHFSKMPLLTGEMSYIAASAVCFFGKLGSEFSISIDGGEFEKQNLLFAVSGNSRWYGGGFMPAPHAFPDDGLLDFVVVKNELSKIQLASFFAGYKQGKHLNLDVTSYRRGKKMTVKSETPAAVNIDGEVEIATERTFEIIEKAISFVVPRGAFYFDTIAADKEKYLNYAGK